MLSRVSLGFLCPGFHLVVSMRTLKIWIAVLAWSSASGECISAPQRQAFQHAAVVFKGRVVGIEDASGKRSDSTGGPVPLAVIDPAGPQVVTFRATTGWKGPVRKEMRVFVFRHPPEGSGYTFKTGAEYVVYALKDVSSQWQPLKERSGGSPIFDVGMCVLRVRLDVKNEENLLGRGFAARVKER